MMKTTCSTYLDTSILILSRTQRILLNVRLTCETQETKVCLKTLAFYPFFGHNLSLNFCFRHILPPNLAVRLFMPVRLWRSSRSDFWRASLHLDKLYSLLGIFSNFFFKKRTNLRGCVFFVNIFNYQIL